MRYFLDTNIIIYFLKKKYPEIREHLMGVPSQSIVIPSVVRAEIEYGARKSADYTKTIRLYRKFMDAFHTEGFDECCSEAYGKIREDLEKKGMVIGPNDLMTAATVISKDGVLITHNTKEFSRIEGLRIEDWTEDIVL